LEEKNTRIGIREDAGKEKRSGLLGEWRKWKRRRTRSRMTSRRRRRSSWRRRRSIVWRRDAARR